LNHDRGVDEHRDYVQLNTFGYTEPNP